MRDVLLYLRIAVFWSIHVEGLFVDERPLGHYSNSNAHYGACNCRHGKPWYSHAVGRGTISGACSWHTFTIYSRNCCELSLEGTEFAAARKVGDELSIPYVSCGLWFPCASGTHTDNDTSNLRRAHNFLDVLYIWSYWNCNCIAIYIPDLSMRHVSSLTTQH